MNDDYLMEQAIQLEHLLPRIARRLFTLDPEHPANEMPVAQLRVCAILFHGPRTLSALSEELGISVSAMTQIADRMEKVDFVERIPGIEDRRTRFLQLSSLGRKIMHTRYQARINRVSEVLRQMSPEKRILALESLQELLEAGIRATPDLSETDLTLIRQVQS